MKTFTPPSRVATVLLLALFTVQLPGCARLQLKRLHEDLEDSRGADARRGVLARELDNSSRARLELLGRSSAPTQYAERIGDNRIRVVAFDFGGASLGRLADPAGALKPGSCLQENAWQEGWVETGPWDPSTTLDTERKYHDERANLYKGMFRQYGRQIGTTVEFDGALGPLGAESSTFYSQNFLVLEWRRYRVARIADTSARWCFEPFVAAVEEGIAVRVVFNVKLSTTDNTLSASFGVAQLRAALARNEATVEVSYEVVGTTLDLLPKESIVISSLNEYSEAIDTFHRGIATIKDAWEQHTTGATKIKIGDHQYPHDSVFVPDQIAYYVDGPNVGKLHSHATKVEFCSDLKRVKKDFEDRVTSASADIDKLEKESAAARKQRRSAISGNFDREEARRTARNAEDELSIRRREYARLRSRKAVLDELWVQNQCEVVMELNDDFIALKCAQRESESGSRMRDKPTLLDAQCAQLSDARRIKFRKYVDKQEQQQQQQLKMEQQQQQQQQQQQSQ